MDELDTLPSYLGRYAGFVTRLVAFIVDRFIVTTIVAVTVLFVQYVLDAFAINQLFGLQSISWQVVPVDGGGETRSGQLVVGRDARIVLPGIVFGRPARLILERKLN